MPLATLFFLSFLSVPRTAPVAPAPTGVWVLNPAKSELGLPNTPREVVIRVEYADESLAIWEITTSARTRRLSYRQARLNAIDCAAVARAGESRGCWVATGGGGFAENWELSDLGELIIDRNVSLNFREVHQRLVLEPSTVNAD